MNISTFKGLNNVTDPLRLGVEWLVQAENVDISETGALSRREGYTTVRSGEFYGAYSTLDYQRTYYADGTNLTTQTGAVIRAGLTKTRMYWTEVNGQVFFNNGTESGIIYSDNSTVVWGWPDVNAPTVTAGSGRLPAGQYGVRIALTTPDGRQTGSSDATYITVPSAAALQISCTVPVGYSAEVFICPADSTVFGHAFTLRGSTASWDAGPDSLGHELPAGDRAPLPLGSSVVQHWRGRMYAAQYFPSAGATVIWMSDPLAFHLFDVATNFIQVPGQVFMLAPTDSALIIGTDQEIYGYDSQSLSQLANYGVTSGDHWDVDDDGSVVFWSSRGACRALPFKNLTERQVSVPPGVRAGGILMRSGGQKRYVVSIAQGGSAFNSF